MGKRIQNITLKDLGKEIIKLGYVGENDHTEIYINCAEVFLDYPDAIATMVVNPPVGDSYYADLEKTGNKLQWTITSSDVAHAGSGKVQLTFTDDEEVIKTVTGSTSTLDSLEPHGEAPEPVDAWQERIEEARALAEAAGEMIDEMTVSAEETETVSATISDVDGHKHIEFGIPAAPVATIEAAVDTWLGTNITNPDSPPLDRSLSSSSAAAPADLVGAQSEEIEKVNSAIYNKNTEIYNGVEPVQLTFANGWINSSGVYDPSDTRFLSNVIETNDLVELANNSTKTIYVVYLSSYTSLSNFTYATYATINSGATYTISKTYPYMAIESSGTAVSNLTGILLEKQSIIKYLSYNAQEEKKAVINTTKEILEQTNGVIVPNMELGTIAFSSSSIVYIASTTEIRTPNTVNIQVNLGDIITLTDLENYQFKVAIQTGESTYAYSAYRTTDYKSTVSGRLYVVVKTSDGSAINVADATSVIRITTGSGDINELGNRIEAVEVLSNITADKKFNVSLFKAGSFDRGVFNPNERPYRVSSFKEINIINDLTIIPDSGYRVYVQKKDNGSWSMVGWQTSAYLALKGVYGFILAKVTEDTSSTANPDDFVPHFTVQTNYENSLALSAIVAVDDAKIQTHMARMYDSELAESYIFFTDQHLMGTNGTFNETIFNNYVNYIRNVKNRITADYIVSGGDWLNSGDTKAQASFKLGFVDGKMTELFGENYYPLAGNHDYNYLGVDGQGTRLDYENWVSQSGMHNIWFHRFENCYYKFKKAVAVNYMLDTRTDYDGTNDYDKGMLDWFAGQLITDDPEHATIMMHMYALEASLATVPTRVHAIGTIISAFNSHTVATLTSAGDGYEKTYDFTSTTGHIDYVVVGHAHKDYNTTLGGVPLVGVANFQNGGIPTFDLIFADYTNGKLYTTRIGTGNSREFNI